MSLTTIKAFVYGVVMHLNGRRMLLRQHLLDG